MNKTNVVQMQQVHGNNVFRVDINDVGTTIPNCDALISNDSNISLCVRVADCLPISMTDQKTHSFGLIHAGWRGLENKVIAKTLENMIDEFSITPANLEVKIGPHICQKHFEVKDDVSSKFRNYPDVILVKSGKQFLGLAKIAELQLLSFGLKKENITVDPRCTFEDKNLFSYRRNKIIERNVITLNI